MTTEEQAHLKEMEAAYTRAEQAYFTSSATYRVVRERLSAMMQELLDRSRDDPWWHEFPAAMAGFFAAKEDMYNAYTAMQQAEGAWRQAALELATEKRHSGMAEDER